MLATLLVVGLLACAVLASIVWIEERRRLAAEVRARELSRSERTLRQSEARLRALIERLPSAVSVYLDGRVAFANPAMLAMLRRRACEEIVGRDAAGMMVDEDRPRLARALAACRPSDDSGPAAAGSEVVPVEARFATASGPVHAEGFLLPLLFDGLPAVLGAWQDVSQKRQLAARMMQMDRMIAVGTLAAGVAHEINNPLAYVSGNIDYALGELSRPELTRDELAEVVEALREARDGSERMRSIVRDLRTYSRAGEERRGPVDVRRAVEWACAMSQKEVRQRARLALALDPVPSVDGEEGRLGQVLLNLLVNAAHAVAEGAPDDNEIRVAVRGEGARVVIEVSDTGVGIAPEHLPRIFDPFFTTKPVGVGTGLGLAIAQRIVTDFGGELRVESRIGRGTLFRVSLPVSGGAEPASSPTPPPAAAPPPRVAARRRVLLVDDEIQVLRALQRGLSPTHEVVSVTSALEALDRIGAGERFDAIVCDLMMPEMTGMDLHARLLSLSPEAARRTLFITGGAFTPRAREFLERVPDRRLDKPFDADAVRRLIDAVADAAAGEGDSGAGDGSGARAGDNAPI
jgi:C4-dicarboxylate-specific signal transduction histidine kinase/CheY-like chemotaxis protein